MSQEAGFALFILAFLFSCLAFWGLVSMTIQERKEYDYYLEEFRVKVGGKVTWRQKLSAWNGAKGGPSPKWHWIKPVHWPFGK